MNIGISLNGKNSTDLNEFSIKYTINDWYAIDGGLNHLNTYNIIPNKVIGDLDSIDKIDNKDIIKYNTNKDKTDGELAVKYVLEKYPDANIHVIGAIDDTRIEHFYNNLISYAYDNVYIYLENNLITYSTKDIKLKYIDNCDYVSLFAITDLTNLTISNAKYNVDNMNYKANQTFGISNEFIKGNDINIKFDNGILMIIYSIYK